MHMCVNCNNFQRLEKPDSKINMLHHNQGLAKTCIKKNHEIEFKIEIHQKRDKKSKK